MLGLYKFLSLIEFICAQCQGKGWGSFTTKAEIKRIQRFIKNPKLAIDIGGNVGDYSERLAAVFPDIEIHLFEPSQTNFNKLKEKWHHSNANITINPLAVSHNTGTYTLFSDKAGSGMASLTKRRLEHIGLQFDTVEQVKAIKFEDYWTAQLDRRAIDLIKIDVEGHELDVLTGLGEAINKTKLIQFEFGGCNIDTKTYFQDFWYFLKDHSYKIYRITPLGLQLLDRYREQDETFSTTNFLCIKTTK